MENESSNLPPLFQDAPYVEPTELPVPPESRQSHIERERLTGFPSLSPMQRKVGIDFVLSGSTLKALAKEMDMQPRELLLMMGNPLLRAFISELQKEYAAHRLLTETWVEIQILKNMPKLEGEEPIPVVTRDGEEVERCKYHAKELIAIFKHFGGNQDQKKHGGVHVTIDFGKMGVSMDAKPVIPGEGTVIDFDAS